MWTVHRALTDRLNLHLPFSPNNKSRILVLSVRDEISHAQLFPYFKAAERLNIQIRELSLKSFLAGRTANRGGVDSIYFQTWFDLTDEQMNTLLDKIEHAWPGAPLTYLDWFAPTDLRYAQVLTPRIKTYVKKQILSDFAQYGQVTLGDTNLTHYYAQRFKLPMPSTQFKVPDGFREKLVLGPGFEYSPRILKLLERPSTKQRTIDLHARIATSGADWYAAMRTEARKAVDTLPSSITVAKDGRVSRKTFLQELRGSKVCFSPFGYGEVCWRDFESMSTGAVLVKPDMSHLRLGHDIFVPGETYIPVKWDLSDFRERVEMLLASPSELARISKNAYHLLESITQTTALPQLQT